MAFDAAAFDAEHHAPPVHDPGYDPIVEEVRAAREALFAEAGYDLEELFRQVTARQDARRRAASAAAESATHDGPQDPARRAA